MFKEIKTGVQEWQRLKCYIVLEWYKSRPVLKHTLQKDPLKSHATLIWERKMHFTLYLLSLSLMSISTFWYTHFFQWHSLGKCHLVHWLFHWVPFLNNYCLLDESLNIPVSLSGGKLNSLAYQNVSLELIQNNKQSMFSLMEVITLISMT